MNDKTPAEKAAEILFTPGRVNTTKGCAAIIQAAIDETVRDVYSRAGYGPRPAEVNEMSIAWQMFIHKHQTALNTLESIKKDYAANGFKEQPWLDLALRQLQLIVDRTKEDAR